MDTPERPDTHIPDIGYHWHPIEDLPEDWPSLADPELKFWITAWESKRESLEKHAEMGRYLERLKREWSIETGLIENLYRWEPGVTQTLIEHGFLQDLLESSHIDGDPELIGKLLNSQLAALEMVMDYVGGGRPLSEADILDLHKVLTEYQEAAPGVFQGKRTEIKLLKGEYKRWPNNPTRRDGAKHQYCPPEQVKPQIEQLLSWHQEHLNQGVAPEVEAAWLHHRFVQIHPFQDGNGRVARCLAAMVMIKAGAFPLVVKFAERPAYYEALQQADTGDLRPLSRLFASLEREEIKQVMELEGKLVGGAMEEILRVGSEILQRGQELETTRAKALSVAEETWQIVLDETSRVLDRMVSTISNEKYRLAREEFLKARRDHDFDRKAGQLIPLQSLHDLEFFRLCDLMLTGPHSESHLIVVLSQMDQPFAGRLRAVAIFDGRPSSRVRKPEKGIDESMNEISSSKFEFSYRDESADVQERFRIWLEATLTRGLALWFEQERRIIDALAEQENPPES